MYIMLDIQTNFEIKSLSDLPKFKELMGNLKMKINKSQLADHYGTVVVPALVSSPKDKASVEGTVGFISRQIIASLRNYQCFCIRELNMQIHEKLIKINTEEFQKRPGSRKIVFEEEEKSYLHPFVAQAFGVQACRQFFKVEYVRLPELLDELQVAKTEADGSFRKLIQKYKKIDLLILDEWLLYDLTLEQSADVLEIIEARLKKSSTILCSQFAPEGWHSKLGQIQLADAILDRIIHDSYKILIDGKVSMRERHGINQL